MNALTRAWRWATVSDGILLIPLTAVLACLTLWVHGISCGHDFEFHLVSWMEAKRAWSQGVLYPHWAQSPNWEAGEPRFVFYPPVTWMLGAALGCIVPWTWVPVIISLLFLSGSGFATRALARQFLPGPVATAAGCLATATPYAFFSAFERTAYSEMAAAIWIPLLLLFALRQKTAPQSSLNSPQRTLAQSFARSFDGSAALLALVLAACWLTNAPSGVMASYLLAFTALVAALALRAWWPVLRAAAAAVIGIGLTAFYLVPAAWEQRWIAINQALDVGMRIADSWLFARHASPDLLLHDEILWAASTIFVFTAAMGVLGLGIALLRGKLPRETRTWWLPLALLIPALLLLQLPFSAPLWRLLPKLQFLQFPWRWLMVLGTPFAIFLAAATPLASRRARWASLLFWALAIGGYTTISTRVFFQFCDEEDRVSNQVVLFQDSMGVAGTDEYAPSGADNTLVASGLPDACLVNDPTAELGKAEGDAVPVWIAERGICNQTYKAQLWQDEHKQLEFNSDQDGFLILRLRRYPAWRITVNGKQIAGKLPQRDDGLIVLPLKEGPARIDIRWQDTPDIPWGRDLSLAALVALLAIWFLERRTQRA